MSTPGHEAYPDFSDSLAADFATPNQQILAEEFAQLTTANRVTLQGFDPYGPTPLVEIELRTSFREAERVEPLLAAQMRRNMLAGLGLQPQDLQPNDPTNYFQHRYRDGEVDQIRLVTR